MVSFWLTTAGIPLLVTLGLIFVREDFSNNHSIGGDITAAFIAIDFTVLYSPESFSHFIQTPFLAPFLAARPKELAAALIIFGFGVLFLCVSTERRLSHAPFYRRRYPGWLAVVPYTAATLVIITHSVCLLGDWS